ncbi:MAG: DNA polymerase III subunit gamma/tau [Polyangiaceae bacterium]
MSYVVLARKWRPMRFEDLVGQDHVAKTLENAIKSNRVAHAFLFTGVRGVGKTTSARILAKALNCMGAVKEGEPDPGPTWQPCLECRACKEIAAGTDVDVREIDGASYNGVDEVRKLQEQLPYRPAHDRYKIFIVDEVHMLSQSAWNAFLKTLEEPPPHVKFIFATTEVHKVPITILSRVQRFDFKLIPSQLIATRLREVLQAEGIAAEDSAIQILAREAAGSMRDAMSLLDQVIAWGGAQLAGDDVARVLGVASRQVLHDISGALVAGDAERCLSVVSHLAEQGFDMSHVARDLLALLRDLVVAKVCSEPKALLDLADEEVADVIGLAGKTDTDDLLRLHQGFSANFDDVVRSAAPRAALEMALVRLARRPPLLPIDDLVGRLQTLERRLAGAARSAGAGQPGPAPQAMTDRGRPRAREPRPERGPRGPEPGDEPPAEAPPRDESPVPPTRARASTAPPQTPHGEAAVNGPREQKTSEPTPEQAVEPDADSASAALTTWVQVLDALAESHPEHTAVLEHAALLGVSERELHLGYEPGSVFAQPASEKALREALAQALTRVLGRTPHIHIELECKAAAGTDTVAAAQERARQEAVRKALAAARRHPAVVSAIEILGARIKDLKLTGA